MRRRTFLGVAAAGMATVLDPVSRTLAQETPVQPSGVHIGDLTDGEDVFRYVRRVAGRWDPQLYKQ
ncbi:MAG: hypothetical protein AB7F89_25405, partial [Pirellulaceae bacterium]